MHAENFSESAVFSASPGPTADDDDPPSDELVVPECEDPRLATDGDAEPPPHPAASVATAASESARTAMSA
jgi:hypothetical protein